MTRRAKDAKARRSSDTSFAGTAVVVVPWPAEKQLDALQVVKLRIRTVFKQYVSTIGQAVSSVTRIGFADYIF